MKRLLSICLCALILSAGSALAEETACVGELTNNVPAFEAAKRAFLDGDYHRFYSIATPMVPNADEKRDGLMGGLVSALPDGFKGCWTIAERYESPGLYQDVSFFDTGGGPLGLYMMGTVFRDEIIVMQFSFSDSATDALDELR